MGVGWSKNCSKLRDVIYRRPRNDLVKKPCFRPLYLQTNYINFLEGLILELMTSFPSFVVGFSKSVSKN